VYDFEKSGFTLIGIIGLNDKLRKNVVKSINTCYQLGIKVLLATGDNSHSATCMAMQATIYQSKNNMAIEAENLIKVDLICSNC
jgi:magnesium-transporting ATPase (P-type)